MIALIQFYPNPNALQSEFKGRESAYDNKPARDSKKVVIVGGGAAGMESARTAYLRGHEVPGYIEI